MECITLPKKKKKSNKPKERYKEDKFSCPVCQKGYKYNLKDGCNACKVPLVDANQPMDPNINLENISRERAVEVINTQNSSPPNSNIPGPDWRPPPAPTMMDTEPKVNLDRTKNLERVSSQSRSVFDSAVMELFSFLDEAIDMFTENASEMAKEIANQYKLTPREKKQICNFTYLLLKRYFPKILKDICATGGVGEGGGIVALIFSGLMVAVIIGRRIKYTYDLSQFYKEMKAQEVPINDQSPEAQPQLPI